MSKFRVSCVFEVPRSLLDMVGQEIGFNIKEFNIYIVPGVFLKTGLARRETFVSSFEFLADKFTEFSVSLGEVTSPRENLVVSKFSPVKDIKNIHVAFKRFLTGSVDGTIREPEFTVQMFIGPDKEHMRRKLCKLLSKALYGRKLDIIGFQLEVYSPANNRWEPLGRRFMFLKKAPA